MADKVAVEVVAEFLEFDPSCPSHLRWRKRAASWFVDERAGRAWNTRYGGKPAGTRVPSPSTGYHYVAIFGKFYAAHQLVYVLTHGVWPEGQIDHIDGDKTNNDPTNLRDASNAINHRNLPMASTNTSGVTGVSRDSRSGGWQAGVTVNGKGKNLGRFATIEEAAAARAAWMANHGVDLGFTERHGKRPLDCRM